VPRANEIGLLQVDFGSVLDEENPVFVRNKLAEGAQQGRLATAGSTANEDVLASLDVALQPGCKPRVQSAHSHEVFDCEVAAVELGPSSGQESGRQKKMAYRTQRESRD